MSRRIISLLILIVSMTTTSLAQFESAPAFPGAEGHGRFVTGGRGGNVIHVTNLNDSGTGSFRAAVSGNTAKIIVFDVAGVIPLTKEIVIGDNTTIEGQTAPYPGITIRYFTVRPGGNNIIRYIRFRHGDELSVDDGADAAWQRQKTGMILDHCSFSWSIDEVASFYDNNNFTMQWCTVAESLVNSGHSKGAHGYGGIWGGKLASFHHNMIAHVKNRGPRFCGARFEWSGYTGNQLYSKYNWANTVQAENVDFRNCVMYDAQATCYGGPGGGQINMVNNFYKAGPRTSSGWGTITLVTVGASGNSTPTEMLGMTSRYYISGNTAQQYKNGTIHKNYDWSGVSYDSGTLTSGGDHYSLDPGNYYPDTVPSITNGTSRYIRIKMDKPVPMGYINTHIAATAYDKVLKYVGASMYRDTVDARYVKECTYGTATYTGSVSGTLGLIDLASDCKAYTEDNFPTGSREAGYDTDSDGIPDAWETQRGLNPNDASDGKTYTLDEKKYYTNLEVYCNSLVEKDVRAQLADADNSLEGYYTEYFPKLPYNPEVDGPIVNMTKINLDKSEVKIAGKYGKISAVSCEPENASLTINDIAWTSSNDKVVEIINPKSGLFIVKGLGTATITATAQDSAHVTATATVTVLNLGDANGDNKVSMADANAVVNSLAGKTPEGFIENAANITETGTVNAADATGIMSKYLCPSVRWDLLFYGDMINAVNTYGEKYLSINNLFFNNITSSLRKYALSSNTYGDVKSVTYNATKEGTTTYPTVGYVSDVISSSKPKFNAYMGNYIGLNLGTDGWAEFTSPEIPAGKYKVVIHYISDGATQRTYYTNGTSTMFTLDGNEVTVDMLKGLVYSRYATSFSGDVTLWDGLTFNTTSAHTLRITFKDANATSSSNYHQYFDYVEFIPVK